jgi:type IV pilus assembly protein PilV
MLEVLVAVVVLAIGIVGGAEMQLAALRARHQSALLSQATQLASNLAERMRANTAQLLLPDGANSYLSLDYDALAEPDPAAPVPLCYALSASCDSGQLAMFDLYELKTLVRDRLPGGRAVVCHDAGMWQGGSLRWACSGGAGAPLVIKVGWRGKNPDGTPVKDDAGQFMPGVAIAVGAGL